MRVTLDLDEPSQFRLLKTYFNLKSICGRVDEIRVSSSGRGYHLIVRHLPISFEDSLRVRAMLGECSTRLRFDGEDNHKPKNLLWKKKIIDGKKHEVVVINERQILAEPFWSKIPRGVFVNRRGGGMVGGHN